MVITFPVSNYQLIGNFIQEIVITIVKGMKPDLSKGLKIEIQKHEMSKGVKLIEWGQTLF